MVGHVLRMMVFVVQSKGGVPGVEPPLTHTIYILTWSTIPTQGCGMALTEEALFDHHGKFLTDSTWNYKIPSATCIPREMHVQLLEVLPCIADVMMPI